MKSIFDLPQEEFEKEIDKLLDSLSGANCFLCGYELTNADEAEFPDKPQCCENHGFIQLCPTHAYWFWKRERIIGERCIKSFWEIEKQK